MSFEIQPYHAVPLELANTSPAFVERARQYQWKKFNPKLPVGAAWPPGTTGSFGVYDYWFELIQKNRRYSLDTWVEPQTFEEAVELALELSVLDPFIQTSYSIPQFLQVNIAGKDYHVRASKVVSWMRFAGSTYDVILDDDRRGRVTDAAFELKVNN